MISKYDPATVTRTHFNNYVINLCAGIFLIALSGVILSDTKHRKWQGLSVMYVFSFVCLNFGMIISENSYAKGEQILTFLTMELFVICLLIWRPAVGFAVLTVSYHIFFHRLNGLIAFNTGTVGTTESTQINGFTMWISTLIFCISNYNRTLQQALKDENLEKMNSHLSKISVEDELTGIHNMVHFRAEAEKLLGYVTTDKEDSVFLFFDIENFKSYNEKYGFHAGNELLIKIAHLIEDEFKGSLVSRFSDDHFVVLTRSTGAMEKIMKLSGDIKDNQGEVHLELKCGAYQPSGEETDSSLALDRARFACNSIKKHFDRPFRMYDKSLEDKFQLKQYIVNNIDHAIENGFIKVYYQPVVSTENGCICGLEALARWLDPNYGLLPPGSFIEILEEYRQIHKLDQCIIEQVCRDYRGKADAGEPFVPVSLNFSRLDFELCDIVGYLTETAEKYNVPKHYLDVEITESALTDQQDFLQNAMKVLRSSGYKIWLDDFGSGYSSLNVLKDYQFDVLKIDMKFLHGFANNQKTRPILENIVSLTKQLNMISLTEGVETKEQYEFLKNIGCDRAQGYLFSKPVPGEELWSRVKRGELKISPEYSNAG
ncbi:MAG: bifunctional diguanylate cyclase/phosphodiesterase [Ruminococcus sp.]|nr:bifunctional diguanylate cyclase/phosphodiesterase [Ruminococcus sp.]